MAEQTQHPQQISAPFPAPPPFYKHFTKENTSQLRRIRREADASQQHADEVNGNEHKRDVDILSLPPELRYLIPPPPPTEGKYKSFGQDLDLNQPEQTLAGAGIEQLYPSHPSVKLNPQPHLLGLARSLLTTFLSLVGIMSQNPELYDERVASLQTIMFNMHDLINQYRPHQARESLIMMMEERVEKMKDEMRRIEEAKGKVSALMQALRDGADSQIKPEIELDGGSKETGDGADAKRIARQRAAWAAMQNVAADLNQ